MPFAGDSGVRVELLAERVICCSGRGHLTTAHSREAQATIESLAAGRPLDVLYDGLEIESFDPGLPMAWVRWSLARTPRARRVAIVGRIGPSLSIASTFRYLLPWLRIGLFADRASALRFLGESESLLDASPPARSD